MLEKLQAKIYWMLEQKFSKWLTAQNQLENISNQQWQQQCELYFNALNILQIQNNAKESEGKKTTTKTMTIFSFSFSHSESSLQQSNRLK